MAGPMAKAKRSAADLDAELAALEAELAQLEGRKQAKPKAAAPPPEPEAKAEAEPPSQPRPAKARARFALPKRQASPRPAASPPAPVAAPVTPKADASLWRQEDGAWIRTVPGETAVVRRILDETGALVREEPASARDLEEETPVKAERGIGKLFRRRRA